MTLLYLLFQSCTSYLVVRFQPDCLLMHWSILWNENRVLLLYFYNLLLCAYNSTKWTEQLIIFCGCGFWLQWPLKRQLVYAVTRRIWFSATISTPVFKTTATQVATTRKASRQWNSTSPGDPIQLSWILGENRR